MFTKIGLRFLKETLNKFRRTPAGSFALHSDHYGAKAPSVCLSVMLRQMSLDVALLRLRAIFLA